MNESFPYDVFLSHSAKDKAVVRPLAERLRTGRAEAAGRRRKDGLHDNPQLSTFNPQPVTRLDAAPIKDSLAQFPCVNKLRPVIHCFRWN